MTNLAALPIEIVSLIVDHVAQQDLYTCTQVNTLFYVAANPLLWRTIHLQHPVTGLRFLYCLVKAEHPVGAMIRNVHLENFPWNDKVLMVLMRRVPFLVSLVLDNASRITDNSMQHLAHYWPHLQSLYLFDCPITHVSYHVLGHQCPKLTNLELWNCSGLLPTTFKIHFAASPLKKLTLDTWFDEDDEQRDSLMEVVTSSWWKVGDTTLDLTGLHQLTHLKIHGPPFGMLHKAMMTRADGFFGCMPQLVSLDMEACFDMVDEYLLPFICRLPARIKYLALKDAQFTDTIVDAIARHLPTIVELDISWNNQVTSDEIHRLVRRCRCLALVTLGYCGIHMEDFPEAQPQCAGQVVTHQGTSVGLHHLDQQAIDTIQCVPSHLGNQIEEQR